MAKRHSWGKGILMVLLVGIASAALAAQWEARWGSQSRTAHGVQGHPNMIPFIVRSASGEPVTILISATIGAVADNDADANTGRLHDPAGTPFSLLVRPQYRDPIMGWDSMRGNSTDGLLMYFDSDLYHYAFGSKVEPYKHFAIEAASIGDNQLVAAVGDAAIRLVSMHIQAHGVNFVRFEDGAGGSVLSGRTSQVDASGFVKNFNPAGWFQTSTNTALSMELSAAVTVSGDGTYVEIR